MNKQQRVPNKAAKTPAKRAFSTKKATKLVKKTPLKQSKRNIRVAVIGAAGGIGQPLSMLIKLNNDSLFTELSLFDVNPVVSGVAADLSHIPSSVEVTGFTDLEAALQGAEIVVVPAGVPRKPGMTRDDLFNVNAQINFNVANAFAKVCPQATACIISNPVNSMVPLWAEVLKSKGVYQPGKVLGVTTLDIYRATTFAAAKAQELGLPPIEEAPGVLGGHAGKTIVALFSSVFNKNTSPEQVDVPTLDALYHRVSFGGDEVVQAKAGGGSATLSMASAGARFTESVAHALSGTDVTPEYAFTENPKALARFGTEFFSSKMTMHNGVVSHDEIEASPKEIALIEAMVPELKEQIKKGQDWAKAEIAKVKQ